MAEKISMMPYLKPNNRKETIVVFVQKLKWVAFAFLATALVQPAFAADPSEEPVTEQTAADQSNGLPLEDLRKFADVFDRIKKAYVEDVDDSVLLNNAIRGMLAGLDPHSSYLEPSAFDDLQETTSGEFGGLGIEVGMEGGFIKVITPIDDTPAKKAGIDAGDLIIKLGDRTVKGMSLQEAVNLMRGKPGTSIRLTVVKRNSDSPVEIDVVRDVIRVTSVKNMKLDEGYGYIRVTQFQAQTGADFIRAIELLKEKNTDGLKGMVIDLRNNPGGVLQAAVEVADAVLEEGLIVYTEGRIKSSRLRFTATPGDETDGIPIVVLINGGSASASEIVAGALQDQSRAIILGTESFGKGSVQTVLPLDEAYGLKLTTARYYTPNGRSIQALGIKPDIRVQRATVQEEASAPIFKEADLSGHLSNENGENGDSQENSLNQELLSRDFQLREALNLLKGLNIMATRKG